MQWSNGKEQTMIYKTLHRNLKIDNDLQSTPKKTKDRAVKTPLKTRGEHRCSGRVGTFCFSTDTRRATLLINDKGCNYLDQSVILCSLRTV
jgi:hypothetical protein